MNRTEKKQIDDSIGLYHETYRKNGFRHMITLSDIRNTKIREDLENDRHVFELVKTDEQKSYFVNKCNELMLKRRNHEDAEHQDFVEKNSDILYHSIDDYYKHSCFLKDLRDNENQERHTNALNQIAKLQNVNETDYDLELHNFLDRSENEIFNELEEYKDESRDIVKDRCSVKLNVPAIVLAQLYKTSRLLDFTEHAKKEKHAKKEELMIQFLKESECA